MKTFFNKLYNFSGSVVRTCGLLLTGLLLLGAFLSTCYTADMNTQKVLTKWDNPFAGLLGIGLFLLCFGAIWHFVSGNPGRRRRLLCAVVLSWCLVAGFAFIFFGRTLPSADAMSVFSMAEELARGNLSLIHPTDSYISYYPQQIGLIAFYELLIRLWNLLPFGMRAYPAIQALYVLLACVIVLYQYKSVHLLWKNDSIDCLYLLLAGANLPLLMYTSFVYGEIPSFAAVSMGSYYLLKVLKNDEPALKWRDKLINSGLSLLALTLSVLLRKNSLILIIAVVIVVLLQGLRERKPLLLLYALLCMLCAVSILPLVQKAYEHRADSTINSGVPAISYFAMGMQESSRADGWYNGFNFYTYQDTGLDTDATTALSKAAISNRLTYFRANPRYTLRFYRNKFLSQWADGSYACRQATYATDGGRRGFIWSLYTGTMAEALIAYCNAYQNLLYLGAFVFCMVQWLAFSRARQGSASSFALPVYLGLIGVLGGFLFHLIWEANSRYIFPYSLLLLPYAAWGLHHLLQAYDGQSRKRRLLFSLCLLITAVAALGIAVVSNRDSKAKQTQLQRLKTESYHGVFCSMYPVTAYNEEDFALYRGVSTLIVQEPAAMTKDLSDYLETAFTSGNTISNIYLGLDPYKMWASAGNQTAWERHLSEDLVKYITANPGTDFEVLLPYYSEKDWMALSEEQIHVAMEKYRQLTKDLEVYANVTLYFAGQEEWLIANPDNYTDAGSANPEISRKLFLLTFCDHAYQVNAESIQAVVSSLEAFLAAERQSPKVYPDFSDWDIVFFGDSVIGNFTDSSSIPGVVSGLSHARTYNCAKGGTAASVINNETLSFPLSVAYFVQQDTEALADVEPFFASLQQFAVTEHTDRKLVFIINFGLNDYFDGYAVSNPDDPWDTGTYAGALRTGIRQLHDAYPDALLVLMTPTFTTEYDNGTAITSENGSVLTEYVDTAVKVAEEAGIPCMNNYDTLGIDESTAAVYLSDGTHPNERGRFLFARQLLSFLDTECPKSSHQ
ncbi:MAG: SGNH/GDSL hydrolase family protein [Lachnospiraceae bacterium]|nr:SGNH/GDSL hydrolase family protein [Lachnospiraceae bacterium]